MIQNPRHQLIELMESLDKKNINCANCTGVCCTDLANSMKIDKYETTVIYDYLIKKNLWDDQLEKSIDETINKYRLNQDLSTGKNSSFRRTYTCPFFKYKSLGCALPKEVKPYGCLAFNPKVVGIKKGEDCDTDPTLLENIDQEGEKFSIPVALKKYHMQNKISQFRSFVSTSSNPYFNLALEDYLLREVKTDEPILLIWRNDPSIVWGKFQNPWLECDIKNARARGLKFVRRQSGGGTVYHDLGNLNFSIISDNGFCNRKQNLNFIINALKGTLLELKINERSDLVVENGGKNYKVSGSAFKQVKDRGLHHGTLLINADLENIRGLLNPTREGIESKSIRSVSSSVINLNEIDNSFTYETAVELITSHWEKIHTSKKVIIDEKDFNFNKKGMFTSWDWVWKETPKFSYHNKYSTITIHKGYISEANLADKELSKKIKKFKIGLKNNEDFGEFNFLFD